MAPRRASAPVLALLALLMLLLGVSAASAAEAWPIRLNKSYLAGLMAGRVNQAAAGGVMVVPTKEAGPVSIATTLDPRLQAWAVELVKGLKTRRAAVVMLEADTGKVLALAGAAHGRFDAKVALTPGPAASLFKIVTATAALEETHLTPASRLPFVGSPYTLYRYQVREKLKRRPRYVTLAQSFADSNNVVFARLGRYYVGKDALTRYGRALGFERRLGFELPVKPSTMPAIDTSFELCELACGYHRTTSITPLHGALMAAAVVNGGLLVEPYVVRWAKGPGGRELYRGRVQPVGFAMSFHTSLEMRRLFARTIKQGTARKAFRRLWRDRVLRKLDLGGKTGTLRSPDRTDLYEWFTGYGRDKKTGRSVAVCIMLVHGDTKWGSPRKIARQAIKEAFREARPGDNRLAHRKGR